ncbi:hypothetical protein A3H65_02155 [Candidatus Giovannonibacteria bacterium RIFCSPLOWO2_02_FULL_45_14]|uniref:Uncharacterized protein n=1 Tax=Candidatus Giovannonibacteria bacterium RIFCSPLOWO2_12_FULL_44_15 TaxID=1798364 RepID=A0A1F5Y0W4_9BACT|nr:MAG: hypothetical protein A3C75_02950 [Candidatus Giovannonibacteria bacterium RIFCSPHIGHO2_02_FULL_44_31]OGF76726.1 MAG: hypothetical protein A3E62_02885 [Candidatus Giovannonibacteria bacterium RIFCSPHIGHO2_12_FULL_44_29]OGF90711.1 MAG: hypothetical protein A3H65_02155 [Candidatus Giovannonibacteria bacterium RIFCSPLOWO2_02_FULL_45_14]OGF93807.1 MAG: hypothetical protein A3G54_02310 [Candidatus Giovannonibacteria bacterium RIFCSPLOWO2_12_FULL_44_15]
MERKKDRRRKNQKIAPEKIYQRTALELMEETTHKVRRTQKGFHSFGDQRQRGGYHDDES